MPSAANPNLEKQASTEAGEPIKQAIVMIEHKIRNLEKRKKKIETYKQEQDLGKTLNADQLEAVKKFDEVQHTLTFAQLLSQQFNTLSINHAKQAKKLARREAAERSQQEIAKFREALLIQDTLKELITTPTMRADIIGTGSSGLPQLTEEELLSLEQWLPLIAPRRDDPPPAPLADENTTTEPVAFTDRLHRAAEHLIRVVDSNTRELHGTTYARVKEICQKIAESGYLEQSTETPIVQDLPNPTPSDETSEEIIPASQQDEFSAPLPGQVINPGLVEAAAPPGLCPPPTPVNNAVLQHTPQAAIPPSLPANAPQPSSAFVEPNTYYQQAAVSAVPPNSTVNQATNNVAPLSAPQPNASIPATQFVPQVRPINEVIGSVGGAFNFLQESELDPPEMSVLLPGVTAPVAGAPLPVAGPIPTQTYTNQNFSQTQPPHPQAPPVAQIHPMVVYQQQQQQTAPLQQQPSNVSPPAQQQQIPPKNMAMVRPLLEEAKTEIEPVQQQQTSAPVTTQPQIPSDDWNDTSGDWCQSQDPVASTGDWNQGSIDDWDNMNSNVQSQSPQESRPARMYRGRGSRGGGRGGGGNNSYSGGGGNGGRGGPRGGYQNGRGGGGGYRNNNGDGYYSNQNGYSQRGNGESGYKRGGTRGTGSSRGNGGPRGGGGGRSRGGPNYMRGGGGGIKPQN